MASKIDFFSKLTLKSFLCGLREPLGSTIRAMRPSSMQVALQYINEEDNCKYYQQNVHPKPSQMPPQKFRPPNSNTQSISNNKFPSQVTNGQHKNQFQQKYHSSNQQAYNQPKNVWKPNPNYKHTYNPTPMSTSTRNSNTPRAPLPAPSRNFPPQELFNNEIDHDDQEFYEEPNTEIYSETLPENPFEIENPEENFQLNAENPEQT